MASEPRSDGARPRTAAAPERSRRGVLMVAGAVLAGIVLARVIDWRSHAHPR